jgi:hypothetical protein
VKAAAATVATSVDRAVDALAGFWASADTDDLVDIEDLFEADWLANPDKHQLVLESELVERQVEEQLTLT